MLVRKAAMVAAMSSLALISSTATAREGCWHPNEVKAAQIIDLESKLMVGALKCRNDVPSMLEYYNAFATKHRDMLRTHYSTIMTHFMREEAGDPRGWQFAYDEFRTSSANISSATSSATGGNDCARLAALARVAGQVSGEELLLLAESVVDARGPGQCATPIALAASSGAPGVAGGVAVDWRPAGPRGPSFEGSAATAADPAPRAEQQQPITPALVTNGPAPVEAGSPAALNTAAQTQPSSSDVLHAAVTALKAATAALEMATSSQASEGGSPSSTSLQTPRS